MTTTDAGTAPRTHALYFTAWRWHFYAGLYVAPFLMMLALTGLVMLWFSAMAGVNAERTVITAGTLPMAVSAQMAAAEAAIPGSKAAQYIAPMADDRVAVFRVAADGVDHGVALNPYDGTVVETFVWGDDWYSFASDVHGSLLIGNTGDILIEIAASLAVILIVTGVFLWWPRGGHRAMLRPDLAAKGRSWWKSVHQVTGVWVAALLLVFLISGLSWTGVWGAKLVQAWNTFPAAKWDNVPLSDATHAEMDHAGAHEVPWTLELAPLPASGSLAGSQAVSGMVTIDSVAAFAGALGFERRFQLSLPAYATGVWTISHDTMSNDGPNPLADRTLHIDQFTGNVLADVQFAEYSPYAKAMAVGIAFHEGDLGAWNLLLNTVFCLSVILLSVSGLVMWWKRRPVGQFRLGAPPVPAMPRLWKSAALLMLVLGVAFPLAGAVLLAVIVVDLTLLRALPSLKRMVS